MKVPDRRFTVEQAVCEGVPLNIGIVGQQGSGKTFSAIRLAEGMRRVIGGPVCFIDTEAGRGKAYAPKRGEVANPQGNPPTYQYEHMLFAPPFSPLDYLAAVRVAVAHGARILIIDSMTHEHYGIGGVMWQIAQYIDQRIDRELQGGKLKEFEVDRRRKQLFKTANIEPKMQRRFLNMELERLGVNGIFCYRGKEKLQWGKGEPTEMGIRPETTTDLAYQMTINFLLHEMAEGRPSFNPENEFERDWFKLPIQFRDWFLGQDVQLSEGIGERLARWSQGGAAENESSALLAEIKRLSLLIHPEEATGSKQARGELLRTTFGRPLAQINGLPADELERGCAILRDRAKLLHPREEGLLDDALPADGGVLERHEIAEPFGGGVAGAPATLQPARIEYLQRQAEQLAGNPQRCAEIVRQAAECFHSSGDLARVLASQESEILRKMRELAGDQKKGAR